MGDPLCEVCVDTVGGARAALRGGADRLELCSALGLGGLTPSPALMAAVRRLTDRKVFAMLRPRGGDFVVDRDDLALVLDEMTQLRVAGADGFVFGALTPSGRLDSGAVARVVAAAGSLPVTYHRAFDHVRDPAAAWRELGQLGVARVLTSGGAARAVDGAERIAAWAGQGGPSPLIGGGVRPDNVAEALRRSGAREYHLSGGVVLDTPGRPVALAAATRAGGAAIGGTVIGDHQLFTCDAELVAATRRAAANTV